VAVTLPLLPPTDVGLDPEVETVSAAGSVTVTLAVVEHPLASETVKV
jgi:hypothetical protein